MLTMIVKYVVMCVLWCIICLDLAKYNFTIFSLDGLILVGCFAMIDVVSNYNRKIKR